MSDLLTDPVVATSAHRAACGRPPPGQELQAKPDGTYSIAGA